MDNLLLLHKIFQAPNVVFFPCISLGVVLWHVALIGGDVEAIFTLGGMPDTVLVHLCESGAEICTVWDAHCHVDEGAEVEVGVRF